MGIWYCTREDVKSALDSNETARNDVQVDRAIEAASRSIESLTHRKFYPQTGTRVFDWPAHRYVNPWRLWLDEDEVISVSDLISGGVDLSSSDYFLEPANSGPPHTHIDIDLDSDASFDVGPTWQRNIEVTGVFGYSADSAPAGSLAEALDASETGVDVTDASLVGVGTILRVDDERMIVTGRSMLDTGQNLSGSVGASAADVTIAVASGAALHVGEVVLLDSERMLIVDIAGNSVTVKRAWDGSVLASHTDSDIYALRSLLVERGSLGTTAAIHADASLITRHVVPGPVRSLAIAEAISTIQQEGSGYGRTVGSGDGQREASGKGLADLREQVYDGFGRKSRVRAV